MKEMDGCLAKAALVFLVFRHRKLLVEDRVELGQGHANLDWTDTVSWIVKPLPARAAVLIPTTARNPIALKLRQIMEGIVFPVTAFDVRYLSRRPFSCG
jgi:hypothetical protein